MRTKKINNLYLLLLASTISACSSGSGGGGSDATSSGSVTSLVFTEPYELSSFQNTSGNGYIVISNSDESRSVRNISYSLNSVVGGASKVSIDRSSAENCAIIESLGSCVLKLDLESGAYGGSFVLGASNNSNLVSRIKQSLSTTPQVLAKAPIGINTVGTTTTTGINGIQLSYYPLVDSSNTALVVIVGTVLSSNTGVFNSAVLLDENNQPLALQKVISSNLGAGAANLKQGDSFSISIPVPQENKPLSFKLQINETAVNGSVTNTVTSTTLNTLSTVNNQAILYNYPSAIGLNSANANQTVAVANIGSVAATAFTVSSSNPSVATVTEPALSLFTGKSTNKELKVDVPTGSTVSYTVSLTNPTSPQNVSFNINQSYNNGKTEITTSTSASSSDSPWPSPAPVPTPTPSPTPGPTPAPTPPPTLITITNLNGNAESMMGTSYITFTATISGTGASTLTATMANSVTATIVSDPSPCLLDNVGVTSCTFSILPWYTGFDNSSVNLPDYDPYIPSNTGILLTATNGASITGEGVSNNTINYTITTPYIYLPQTGQTPSSPTNVTGIPGADGSIHSGIPWAYSTNGDTSPSPRFEIVGTNDECIRDNLTGLMWVRNLNSVNSGGDLSWNAALTLVDNGDWCGYDDWRMPNINELRSLINYGKTSTSNWLNTPINNDGGGFSNVQSVEYWTSTIYAGDTTKAWLINMGNGTLGFELRNDSNSTYRLFPVRD